MKVALSHHTPVYTKKEMIKTNICIMCGLDHEKVALSHPPMYTKEEMIEAGRQFHNLFRYPPSRDSR